jgi:hypothetical protein
MISCGFFFVRISIKNPAVGRGYYRLQIFVVSCPLSLGTEAFWFSLDRHFSTIGFFGFHRAVIKNGSLDFGGLSGNWILFFYLIL